MEDKLLNGWMQVHRKLNQQYYSDLGSAIREYGRKAESTPMNQYLFEVLWGPRDLLQFEDECDGYIRFRINNDNLADTLLKSKKDTPAANYMNYCYRWISFRIDYIYRLLCGLLSIFRMPSYDEKDGN